MCRKIAVLVSLLPWLILTGTVQATTITDMSWNSGMDVIEIAVDAWPENWGGWLCYLDGEQILMDSGEGNPVIRPNAPLENPPTGLFVGTDPWVSPLTDVNFPCCGTLQFDIPGEGLTNVYEFNLTDGCETASTKNCNEDDTDPPTPDPMTWSSVPEAIGPSTILMTASIASDPSGVQYTISMRPAAIQAARTAAGRMAGLLLILVWTLIHSTPTR